MPQYSYNVQSTTTTTTTTTAPPLESPYPLTQLINSSNRNTMLTAMLSLILVLLFVLLLNIYAKWFISQSLPTNSRPSSGFSLGPYLVGSRFQHFHDNTTNTPHPHPHSNSNSPILKGLESSVISSIPLFSYKLDEKSVVECVVCLSAFEDGEVGRKFGNCGHEFHIKCIDMWLHSHSTCPICRESVISECKVGVIGNRGGGELSEAVTDIRVEIPNLENENVVVNDSLSDSSSSSSSSSLPLSIKK